MAAVEDGEVAEQHAAAELEGDGFVALAHRTFADTFVLLHEPAAFDHARTGDRHIGEALAPNEAVMEISVATVLIGGALERLRPVVSVQALRRAEDHRAGIQEEVEVVRQVDAAAQVGACRQINGAAAGPGTRGDCPVDGWGDRKMPIPNSTKVADIKGGSLSRRGPGARGW